MKDKDIIRLQHMLNYAREAKSIASGHKQSDLHYDRMLMHTLIRLVEIIGEAAASVSPETRALLPQLEWKPIINMRNKLIHVYHQIDLYILWDTIEQDIPILIEELEKIPDLR
jgi:uncharacterized protein with HEPN domain